MNFTAGTVLLWWTYIDIKRTLDKTNPNQLLEESVRNERAFLAFSIVATIITVRYCQCMKENVIAFYYYYYLFKLFERYLYILGNFITPFKYTTQTDWIYDSII